MTTHLVQTMVDGVVVCNYTIPDDGSIPVPPNPVDPTVPPPSGGSIVPPWPWADVLQPNIWPQGTVQAYPVQFSPSGRHSTSLTQGQTGNNGANTRTQMQVSKVPGVIDPTQKIFATPYNNYAAAQVYSSLPEGWTPEMVNQQGDNVFYAPASDGLWYVNIMHTSDTPAVGFSMQWNEGPY